MDAAQDKAQGLFNVAATGELAKAKQNWVVNNLILDPSVNILAGHSGLGKTALCAQLGMCVAAGKPFFNYDIEKEGLVIYCDQESTPSMMHPMATALARHVGLDTAPETFKFWNPNWMLADEGTNVQATEVSLYRMVRKYKPKLVIVDTLRMFFPLAIKEQETAAAMVRRMRKVGKDYGTSWLLIHHLRKTDREERANNRRMTLRQDPNAWLEEASGTLALINNTDTRLGWERGSNGDLWFGGFLRLYGQIGAYKIIRELDEEGDALGYRLGNPVEQLPRDMQELFHRIGLGKPFSYKTLTGHYGRSKGTASRFIKQAGELGLIRTLGHTANNNGHRPTKLYLKNDIKHEVEEPNV